MILSWGYIVLCDFVTQKLKNEEIEARHEGAGEGIVRIWQ